MIFVTMGAMGNLIKCTIFVYRPTNKLMVDVIWPLPAGATVQNAKKKFTKML